MLKTIAHLQHGENGPEHELSQPQTRRLAKKCNRGWGFIDAGEAASGEALVIRAAFPDLSNSKVLSSVSDLV